jgi:hypothetical protein
MRRMRWAGYVALGFYGVLVGKPEEKRPLVRPGVDGKIILRWIFRKWDVGAWTGLIASGSVQVAGCVNAVMNLRFNKMRIGYCLKMDSAAWSK